MEQSVYMLIGFEM